MSKDVLRHTMPWSDVAGAKTVGGEHDIDASSSPPRLGADAGEARRERICVETGWTRRLYNENRERFIALVEEFRAEYKNGTENKMHFGRLRKCMDARRFFGSWDEYKAGEADPKPEASACYMWYGGNSYKALEKKYWDMLDTTKALPFLRHQTTLKQIMDDMNTVGGIEVWGYPGCVWTPPPAWE